MFEKQLKFGDDARTPTLNGAEQLNKAVVSTLGPLGRNVVIRKVLPNGKRKITVTKDGVTVANEIAALPDSFEDIGVQMVKEAASRTNEVAGDGTTTATLLAFEMMAEGMSHIKKGSNAIHIRRGMQMAVDAVCKKLEEDTVLVEDPKKLKAIATISSQDEEIGALVSLVVEEVGKDGAITVEPGQNIGIEFDTAEGMQVASGFISPHFVNKRDKAVCVLEDVYVLVTDERILNLDQILPVVQLVHEAEGSLVIFAESVEHDALSTLIFNLPWIKTVEKRQKQETAQGTDFTSLAIRAPELGERRKQVMEDIATATGAKLVSKSIGLSLKSIVLADLGRAEKVISTARITTIINGACDEQAITDRENLIRSAIETSEDPEEKDFQKGRLANITGSIGILRVGAASEVEQKEKQHRVEDAIAAVRAASEEGIVSGGGTAYIEAMDCIDALTFKSKDEETGADIVRQTLKKPLWWIAKNAGYEPDDIVAKVIKAKVGQGFNAETGEFVNMIDSNIIDPKKVSRCALENAVSVAGSFLTLEVAITDVSDPK